MLNPIIIKVQSQENLQQNLITNFTQQRLIKVIGDKSFKTKTPRLLGVFL